MTENVLMALIAKLPYGWLLVLLIGWFVYNEVKKMWNCIYRLLETRTAKELQKEQRYYNLLNDYNTALSNNTKALNDFKEVLKDFKK